MLKLQVAPYRIYYTLKSDPDTILTIPATAKDPERRLTMSEAEDILRLYDIDFFKVIKVKKSDEWIQITLDDYMKGLILE